MKTIVLESWMFGWQFDYRFLSFTDGRGNYGVKHLFFERWSVNRVFASQGQAFYMPLYWTLL